eukprot:TRINITY_DN10476_c0_g1_i1.p1 TRINITY_DN10476_c0_g1~~TRINITY_DN10476_c0_g1_i1.p1  ORF type:complete len:522 (-),score=107.39 TRINITY_DN10476_c0_g1_i1:188-1753(-)
MDKKAKYDRQLRLWGEHGQELLENARVCLMNATAAGTETLKNLVLPGIGSFTIVDGNKVGVADLGNNFFLSPDSLGKSRAAATTEYLQELNDLVRGNFLEEDPAALLDKNPSFFEAFTIVIAAQTSHTILKKLSDICYPLNIPVIFVRSNGFIGHLRLSVREHTVLDTKVEHALPDLRIAEPFDELLEYASSIVFEGLDSAQHSSIPYVVILIRALQDWKAKHDGKFPSSTAEKREFKNEVMSKSIYPDEANFEEAYKLAHYAWSKHSVPSEVGRIFQDAECELKPTSSNFWIISRAIRNFVEHEGQGKLPLPGNIPDMHSDTQGYLKLLKTYQAKANTDLGNVVNHVHAILRQLGKSPDSISTDEIRTFCRNAASIQVLRYPSFSSEYDNLCDYSGLANELVNPESAAIYYLLFRSADHFYETFRRPPGIFTTELESDFCHLKSSFQALVASLKVSAPSSSEDYIREFCRYGQSELHNVAAILGGLAAQEVIKLITMQNVPLHHSLILDTTKGVGTVLRF